MLLRSGPRNRRVDPTRAPPDPVSRPSNDPDTCPVRPTHGYRTASLRIWACPHEGPTTDMYIKGRLALPRVSLGRYHSCSVITPDNGSGSSNTEDDTAEQILKKENSAAGIFCWLKANAQTSNLALEKDAVGVVATLARVESDELSRILSEYLGLQTMLAIVCNTNEGVNALEKYNPEGTINCNAGLHGIGSSIKRKVNGRFAVICLEAFRPYVGGFVANDPQKKLAIPKPRFPNEECPAGFIDYAVNMLYLESNNLSFVTSMAFSLAYKYTEPEMK
ncbi:Protein DEFECTIVE IN MERISTEM SILENCING [Arachis hypogaea]|nr:Protein DEFECTIVE IN MERISTEM SILENCING [Arachis hypogaea]